jgi:hypothetical protein
MAVDPIKVKPCSISSAKALILAAFPVVEIIAFA